MVIFRSNNDIGAKIGQRPHCNHGSGACSIGEVSDSGNDGGSGDDNDSDSVEEFQDGLDENLIGDDADRQRLEEMTEKEREQELYNRIERREVLRTR